MKLPIVFFSIDELHILTGVNSLKERAESHLLKIMYKRSRLTDYLNDDPRPTRAFDGPILDVPFPNNELFKKSVLYRGSTLWNDTNPLDRNIATFLSYKTKLKKDLKLKLLANITTFSMERINFITLFSKGPHWASPLSGYFS